jgi:hypothetical protein
VAVFLAQVRGTLKTEGIVSAEDWTDVRQVLAALANAGWAIVPQNQLDGWKKILTEQDTAVNGDYMESRRIKGLENP